MPQQTGLIFTLKRGNFSPASYMTKVAEEDLLDILYFRSCWSLTADIERLAQKYHFESEKSYYLINSWDFLKELLFLLRDEIRKVENSKTREIFCSYSYESYRNLLKANIKDLEWLLFYYNKTIASSEFFQQLSDDCYVFTSREEWLSLCKNWGNQEAKDFVLLLYIE